MKRCRWADPNSELYIAYHDNEWGRPEHDDRKLFEMLTLEGFQAGLSWLTILKKREAFRRAFDNFQPDVIVQYGPEKVEALMADAGIVRNRRKIEAAIRNAGVYLSIQREVGSFDRYLWSFTGGKVILNTDDEARAHTELSDRISKDLKHRGMSFVGTTIIYAFLQAVGVVNDHELSCFCHPRDRYGDSPHDELHTGDGHAVAQRPIPGGVRGVGESRPAIREPLEPLTLQRR